MFSLSGVKKVAPMEVVVIAILIHANKKRMSLVQLSEAIGLLRKDIRKTEKDIRQNTRTMKLFLVFLKDLKMSHVTPDPDAPTANTHVVGAMKRKRTAKSLSPSEDGELWYSKFILTF